MEESSRTSNHCCNSGSQRPGLPQNPLPDPGVRAASTRRRAMITCSAVSSRTPAVLHVAWLAASASLGGPALAQPDARATYDVAPECAPRAEWRAAVEARLPPLLRTHPLLEVLSVHVEKVAAPGGGDTYVGELGSPDATALGRSRSVRGSSCADVLDALSFIGALSLERAASSGAAAARTDPGSAAAAESATPGVDQLVLSRAGSGSEPPRLGAVGLALFQGQLTPARSVSFGAAVHLDWSAPGWQPWLLLGVYASLPDQRRLESGGSVRYEHWSTHAVACPWRYPQQAAWGLRPCLELDLGRSSGEGVGLAAAQKHAAPWLSSGAQLRAELTLWERLELAAWASAVVPIWHAHFYLLPDVQSFETPALGFRAGSAAGLLF